MAVIDLLSWKYSFLIPEHIGIGINELKKKLKDFLAYILYHSGWNRIKLQIIFNKY
jgi:hypothetical protein